jgi:hypothetical protein
MIKGSSPIRAFNASEYADFLGINVLDLLPYLESYMGISISPEYQQYLPSMTFIKLNYNNYFFKVESGQLTLNLSCNNNSILYKANNILDGDRAFEYNYSTTTMSVPKATIDNIQGDYLNYVSSTISNLRNTHAFNLNNGQINNLLINQELSAGNIKVSESELAYVEGNDLWFDHITAASLRVTGESTMGNIDAHIVKFNEMNCDGNGTIQNLRVSQEAVVDYIEVITCGIQILL